MALVLRRGHSILPYDPWSYGVSVDGLGGVYITGDVRTKGIDEMKLESIGQGRFQPFETTTSPWLWTRLTFDFAPKENAQFSSRTLNHKWVRGIRFYRQ